MDTAIPQGFTLWPVKQYKIKKLPVTWISFPSKCFIPKILRIIAYQFWINNNKYYKKILLKCKLNIVQLLTISIQFSWFLVTFC